MRQGLVLATVCLLAPLSSSAPSEGGSGGLRGQTSNNAIPRIGRRASSSQQDVVESVMRDGLARLEKRGPPLFAIPVHWIRPQKRMVDSALYKRVPEFPDPSKRSPWGGSTMVKSYPPKRSALPNDWDSSWGNLLRTRQGFRLHDGGSQYLDNTVMYKRAVDPLIKNNVPLMGKRSEAVVKRISEKEKAPREKRDPQPSVPEEESEDSDDVVTNPWQEYMGGGQDVGLMADSSLDHSDPGPEETSGWLRLGEKLAQVGLPPQQASGILWNPWTYNTLNSG